MYSAIDLCVVCLTYNKFRKSILLQDNEGIVIEDKCRFILNDNVNIRPEVSHICLHCLKNLNFVYNFKQMCLKNIETFNNYIDTLETKKHLKVTLLALQNQKNIEPTYDNESTIAISTPIEEVLIKEEIVDNCVLQDGNVLKGEEAMEENDEFSTLEKPKNMNDNMHYNSSLNEEHHTIENFLNRVKRETTFNLIPDEIQVKDECLFEATDSNSGDNSNNKLLNEGANKPDCNSVFSEDCKNMGMDQNGDSSKWLKCNKGHKEFSYESDIRKHNHINTGERSFKCTTCEKKFIRIDHLKRHNLTHTGEKPYECDVCLKAFNHLHTLTMHKRNHNNDRPYKCSVCHKEFTVSCHLSKHMRIHTGEKPFQCQLCQYKCAESGGLKRHMRIHTGEKPFTCKHCQKPFNQSSSLKRHMRTYHTDMI